MGLVFRRPSPEGNGNGLRWLAPWRPSPTFFLLDEPFANLDANLQSTMVVEVRKILKQEEITALMVTHDKDDALVMADRVAILDAPNSGARSSLVQVDTPEQVYERPASAAAARLTGAVSFIAAVGQGAVARNELGDVPLVETVEGPCTLCLRPENLGFQESPEGNWCSPIKNTWAIRPNGPSKPRVARCCFTRKTKPL